jgi:chemotaxis-related protein WspB
MLFLLFHLGEDRYVLDTAQIEEVLPLVMFKEIPQAPAGVAGAFNYHGAPVPVIDLAALTLGRASRVRMSTRIILVNYVEPGGETHLLGLLGEKTTEMIRREPADFADTGVTVDSALYLGPVTADDRGLIQWIEPRKLLPESVRDALFRSTAIL